MVLADGSNNKIILRTAFTLAEVLITLGIIGIITAMTLPTVITTIKVHHLKTAFKKSYSVLSQLVLEIKKEYGDLDPLVIEGWLDFADVAAKTPKMQEIMRSKLNCAQLPKEGAYLFPSHGNANYKTYSNTTDEKAYVWFRSPEAVVCITTDGMTYMVFCWGGASKGGNYTISVDVNGYNKGPNRWGYDLHTFAVTPENSRLVTSRVGGLREPSSIKTYPCSKNTVTFQMYNGAGCSYYALMDENPDDKSKGYWKSLYK